MKGWLDRSLIVGPYLTLCLSEVEFRRAMKRCTVAVADQPAWIRNDQSDATVHWLTNPKGCLVCIVCVRPRADTTGIQVAAMLVHEAVHIWQRFLLDIGEDQPSAEFEAYSIQAISQRLMEAYAERTS
ncbi:hypothetical protein GT347_20295 [Xylophilus rhododendri]|uniref:Uncharacterized protein n=1 Tax=Xylophilus rhododendri TaxID=2697032 RepID=A0A857JAV7_9BURK|nr:hypothetical protein [Xylophilus rhododendri]QHJ00113.1 hypothetical protein GT347_20295 [Xylophilus rhododendri]